MRQTIKLIFCAVILISVCLNITATDNPRVIVTTDGEIDDQCSLVRFLLYSDEFDVEGIVKTSSQYHAQDNSWAGDYWEQPILEAYAQVYPNLITHDPDYPTPAYLQSVFKLGNVSTEGEMNLVTPGSQLIVDVLLDETDNRTVWLQAWGGTNTIARALKTIEETYPEKMAYVAGKIRFYFIWEQDDTFQSYIRQHWAVPYNIQTIISDQFITFGYWWQRWNMPEEPDSYLRSPWMKENIFKDMNSNPLITYYNERTKEKLGGAEDFIGEGDSPSFIHEIPTGLRNMESPDWGGWGGRYVLIRENTWLDKVPVDGYIYPSGRWYTSTGWGRQNYSSADQDLLEEYFKPITRWIDVMQNDFAARVDWCVKSYSEANHQPVVTLTNSLDITAQPGSEVQFSAQGSYDPDGDQLSYIWWQYTEADSYNGTISIQNSGSQDASFTVPVDAALGQTIHVVCQVTDNGIPSLTRYQRVVVTVGSCASEQVTGVSVSPVTKNIGIGETTQLTATVEPECASNKNVSWSSSNTSVATINSSGLVTGVGYGTAVITVTTQEGDFIAQSTVTIAIVPVTWVTVTPSSTTISVSGTTQLTAGVTPENAADKTVSWSSSNTSVATVSSSGLVTGVAIGNTAITVTTNDGGFTATSDITVSNIVTTTITIQENETGFVSVEGIIDNNNVGFTGDGFANTDNASGEGVDWEICVPENGTYNFAWQYANGSTDDRTAQLEVDGSIEVSNVSFPSTSAWTTWDNSSAVNVSLSAGTHQIRLEATNATGLANIDYISITGNSPQAGECSGTDISVTGVSVLPTSASVNVGATTQLTATVSPSNATNKSVSWTSSNTSVATVSSSGLVAGMADGSANITVTTADGGFTASCNVSVTEIIIPTYELTTSVVGQGSISPTSGTFDENEQVTLTATPVAGWVFDSWSGDASGSTNPVSITMDGNKSVTANFFETTTPTTITIQENETGFCSVDGGIDNNNAGFTGDGFANTDNASGEGITWSVNIPTSGSYSVVLRYANGGSTDRTAQLMEDGSAIVSNISMPSTGSWSNWTETSAIDVNLSAGTKLIRVEATNSSGLANIDYIILSGGSISAVACDGLKGASNTTEIADTKTDMGIKYYPVPVDDLLHIEFSKELLGPVDIYVLDITGKAVRLNKADGSSHVLDMSGLPKGLYTVKLLGENLNRVECIVKQ